MNAFKTGDKVYFPIHSGKIFTLQESIVPLYNLVIDTDDGEYLFSDKGYLIGSYVMPAIFHATPENRIALEQLYGKEFEQSIDEIL